VSVCPGLDDLPAFVSRRHLLALGFGRSAVDAIFRALPVVAVPGVRRVCVARDALVAYLARHTYADDRVRPL
jgi:hypothetical protein